MRGSWAVYALLLLGMVLNLAFFIMLQRSKKERLRLDARLAHTQTEIQELKKTMVDVQKAENAHIGIGLSWHGLETLKGNDPREWFELPGPKLLLIFSELSCDVCSDRLSQAATRLATVAGEAGIASVVHGSNRRYAETYIRTNGIPFSVYFSKENHFVETNNILCTPAALVIGEKGMVLGSHCPSTALEDATLLFLRRMEALLK